MIRAVTIGTVTYQGTRADFTKWGLQWPGETA